MLNGLADEGLVYQDGKRGPWKPGPTGPNSPNGLDLLDQLDRLPEGEA